MEIQYRHHKNSLLTKYVHHKSGARRRGIPFLLTYEEWLKIWTDSGRLHRRGPKRRQFVMARRGDEGPYAVGNVRIITTLQNAREAVRVRRRKRHLQEHEAARIRRLTHSADECEPAQLSLRTRNCLAMLLGPECPKWSAQELATKIAKFSPEDLRRTPRIGRLTLGEIVAFMQQHGPSWWR